MNEGLRQSVLDVVSKPSNAAGVSAATISTGISTALNLIPPVVGLLTSIAGFILAVLLIINGRKKGKLLDLEIKHQEEKLSALEKKHPSG